MKVVGIAGGTASGKTTLARGLNTALGERAALITHDRYYRTMPDAYRGREVDYNFDEPAALDNEQLAADLDALCAGRPARIPMYDFRTCSRLPEDRWSTIDPAGIDVLLVEGILLLAVPMLRERMHHRFFVDTPADIRLARRLRRDILERGDTVDGVLDQYLATVRPMHEVWVEPSRRHAEQVIDGRHTLDVTVATVIGALSLS